MRNENKMLKNKTTKTPPCAELDFTPKQNKTGLLVTSANAQGAVNRTGCWPRLVGGLQEVRSVPATTSFPAHSSLLTKKERARKQDQTWRWAEEREVFGENRVNQGGSQNEESLRIKETYYLEARCTDRLMCLSKSC